MALKVTQVRWTRCRHEIMTIREKVFVCEYRIPPSAEFDSTDNNCDHVLIRDDNDQAIATGRICQKGKISRLAVLRPHRKSDASEQVVQSLLSIAKTRGLTKVFIDSELDQVSTLRQQGFEKSGTVFMDSGIAKQPLQCDIDRFRCPISILH